MLNSLTEQDSLTWVSLQKNGGTPMKQTIKLVRRDDLLGPTPSLRVPPVEGDWPDNSEIPLTYHPVPDIA